LRGSKHGTQKVSPLRRITSVVARVAVAVAILIGSNAASVTTAPATSPASAATTIAGSGPGSSVGTQLVTSTTTGAPNGTTATEDTVITSTTYQETSARIVYRGRWAGTSYSGYLGGRAKWSKERGATATFTFTGTGISWIGPIGPTRGKARIYVNGLYVKTVSAYSSRFRAQHVLFSANYATQRQRTFKIVVLGTSGHPTVAIDALVVRRLSSSTTASAIVKTVNVSSIPGLKTALADNTVDEIVVANGTYHVSPAGQAAADSLWIGSSTSGGYPFASRTRAITVRAETIGGVTFDGGGGSGYGGLAFEAGAHDQVWDGFNFAHMAANYTGIIEIGGYTTRAAPHHITLRHITILATCTGRATTADGSTWDHAIYMGQALAPGPHDLVFEDVTVHGEGNLATAFHFFHGADMGGLNANHVTIRRLTVTGTQQPFLIWEPSVHDVTLDTATISNAKAYAIRYETIGSTLPYNIQLSNITSTGSGYQGFYSSLGSAPPGVTFTNDSLR
jgi:hypothetical protein